MEELEIMSKYTKDISLMYIGRNSDIRVSVLKVLSNLFDNLTVAVDDYDALEKFKKDRKDLIIIDINLPDISGINLIKQIKKVDENTSFIIISQGDENDILLESIKLNVDAYIFKPIDYKQLLQTINKLIQKYKHEQESKYFIDQYLALIDKSSIISKTDLEGKITYVNDSFCEISGYTREEIIGKRHSILRHHENPDELYKDMWNTICNKKQTWEGVVKNKSKSGSSYYIKTIITPIKNLDGNIIEYIAVRDNLSTIVDDKKYLFEQIEENKLSFLILLQIDEYEMLEKFYNTITVDQVEKNFAFNLSSYQPKEYIFENVYSLGSGRFALLSEFNSFSKLKLNIQEYLNNFIENVKKSIIKIDDIEFDLNITISYAFGKYMIFEDCKTGLEDAIANKKRINFSNDFSILTSKEAKLNLDMIKTVKIALDNFNVVSYFQPIIDNKTKKVDKYESLVRLIDEDGNILSPFHFLNISKKSDYYTKITLRVLENSFKILSSINTKLSINLSASDIEKEQTRDKIFELLEEYSNDANRIIFELLEDENIKDFSLIKDFIQKVKRKGVQIAIDDFGTGYSNFERILDFEPDILKIDGSLVKNIADDLFSKNIVESIVMFAKKQNIETIAEFVENEEIFNILNEIGIDFSQGYYFGKPESFK